MRRLVLALLPIASASVGCAASGSEAGDAETATTTSAVVVVERTADAVQGARAEASARFVRVTASTSPASALRSVGAGLDLPSPGACAPLSALTGIAASGDPVPVVELLDVGPVSLEANGVATRLLPRQLPDVTDVVSGVVYARAADAPLLPAAASYVVHVSGGTSLGALDVPAFAPADPSSIRIVAEDVDSGAVVIAGATVGLEWSDDDSGDDVYVDVRPSGVRCLLDGPGHGSVPTVFFDDVGTLSVHRLHREVLRARGIDPGEIRFDFARSIAYVRR